MATHTTQAPRAPQPEPMVERWRRIRWKLSGEALFVAAVLLVAAVLRLVLAARGWPYSNSDEATTGLMIDDIIWHGGRPAFTYNTHHVGALDAYLIAPLFRFFGPTNFALHVGATALMLLFLLVVYLFIRMVYSPAVAGVSIALLALGPFQELFYGLRAGHYAQDMLLLSALLLWLVVLRLRRPARAWARWALDLGIGLVAGLAFWSTILLLPFILAAALALGVEAYRRRRAAPEEQTNRRLARQALVILSGAVIGMLPFLVTTVTTKGIILTEALRASDGPGGSDVPAGPLGVVVAFGQQIAGTFFVGLPLLFGRQTVCAQCPLWPYPGSSLAPADALRVALISAPFSLLVLICWVIAARPLVRNARYTAQQARHSGTAVAVQVSVRQRARAWGRAMLVIGLGLTILQYLISRSAYENSDTSIRYISNIYLCMPLIADPLCRGAQHLWHWFRARRRHLPMPRPRVGAFVGVALLLVLFVIHSAGAVNALQQSTSNQTYGVPAGARDSQVISFMQAHQATRFYTTWWVCHRLMFDAAEQVYCGVVSDTDAFTPDPLEQIPAYAAIMQAAPHPAYLFDLTTSEVDRSVPQQISQRIAAGDPRFAGYTSANVAGYIVFYYAGPGI